MNRAEAIIDLSALEKNVKRLLSGASAAGLAVVKDTNNCLANTNT